MKTYVVRIYRHEKDKPHRLFGTVERPGVDAKLAFTNQEELWNILIPQASKDDYGDEGDR